MIDSILKIFIPSQKAQLSSEKDIATIKALIDANHSSFAKTFPHVDRSKLFLGDRTDNEFKLYQPFYFLRPVAVINGELRGQPGEIEGTDIALNIRASAYQITALLLVLVLSLVILFTETASVIMLKIPLMLCFFILLQWLFQKQALKAKTSFEQILEQEPGKTEPAETETDDSPLEAKKNDTLSD